MRKKNGNETFAFADELAPKPPPQPYKDDASQLLNFLRRWPRTTISSRDIRIWGPKAIRDRESAILSAQILAAHGWLIPIAARRWQVVRDPLIPSRSP